MNTTNVHPQLNTISMLSSEPQIAIKTEYACYFWGLLQKKEKKFLIGFTVLLFTAHQSIVTNGNGKLH